ncbi:SDR family NAD(P)-dependent oxidoreductase [Paremcibacter congregatus]|uniref:Protein CapI n=1 Tax=Paremcibacter congregatus TaxID=2043170 RepID=A0A2G4YUC3_9PROT|nr:SDR family NAD(P)-dependent oxidoreductase [Paremcibacter congregatus]PHZ85925.1 protein CapI [Paremcibacter congregatus]QDE26890.1 SDR family NAD(P)-dependent oxidoreductase [Paremcibacter congregatus]
MAIVVTGAAGFIGFNVARLLLERGEEVIGIDNLNDYYDVNLKKARLAEIENNPNFTFLKVDFSDFDSLKQALDQHKIKKVVHLGAQAGVRYSLTNPFVYIQSNLVGHVNIMEYCRHLDDFDHLVYASSSSVYGGNKNMPFSVDDRVDNPVSLYAATKKSDELMSQSYSHLFRLPQTGLRFFTVYGPWGRPDMAMWIFTKNILEGKPIPVFNHGDMLRDFTYIEDIIDGIVRCLDNPPKDDGTMHTIGSNAPHRVYNIGNNNTVKLLDMIKVLEDALGHKAEMDLLPIQPGDVRETAADISAIQNDLGFEPKTKIEEGIPKFIHWYKQYHKIN